MATTLTLCPDCFSPYPSPTRGQKKGLRTHCLGYKGRRWPEAPRKAQTHPGERKEAANLTLS